MFKDIDWKLILKELPMLVLIGIGVAVAIVFCG